ncbi:hypothetical protein [Streptomyces sp. NBC_00893]|uniref:hypothetical protein n=1 Tax=Streptomyces sp. NBC_00893 TaxID=2975862 RepID=UPI00224E95E1|nr:hypothetical protein [Streptomyces sp. NBC_00893]MCX4846571.1 hypothetical protein [Streptomyces sp. NBC_00893]
MGLMSWLRGGGSGGRTDTSTGTDAGAETGAASPSVPRERMDPAELPPIQRMLGAQDLITDPSGFQGSLSTRQDTSLGTPLGHLVSPDAPTGLVHGITAPAPAESRSPVQRSVERPGEPSGEPPVRTGSVTLPVPMSVTLPVPMSVQRAAAGGAPAMTSAGESAVAGLPVRQLVGEQPLVPASAPEPAAEESSGPPSLPSSTQAPPVQRSALPPAPDRPRRAPGLGAPMSALPPTAQRQAAHAAPETERAEGAEGATGGAGAAEAAAASEPPGVSGFSAPSGVPEPVPDISGSTAPLLGDSPLLPAGPEPVAAAPAPAVQRSSAVSFPGPLAPPPTSDPVAPLLADRPVALQAGPGGGVGAVQRSAVDGAEAAAAAVPSAGTGAMPGPASYSPPSASPSFPSDSVPVRWASDRAGVPSVTPAASLPAALQRTATATATATAPGEAARTSYPSRPALQRQAVGGPPVPRSLPGSGSRAVPSTAPVPSATSFTTAGSAAVAAGVAQRMADGSVVFGSPPPSYSASVVQRETESEEPPPPDPPQDAVPEAEPAPEPGPTAEAHGAPGASGASAASAGASGGAPVVTDELVRALYAPLSRLFKADLRLERERAGFLINTRH